MMSRSLVALAVAALAVVCLGTLTVTHRRTELLVGSYHVGGRVPNTKDAPHQPAGYGGEQVLPASGARGWPLGLSCVLRQCAALTRTLC